MKLTCLTATLIAATAMLFPARAADARRPLVLELFTSQSCSSCPPADALLGELARRDDLLPLSFHVTYWNRLGWTDAYSSEMATRRQRSYAASLHQDGVYTPELIVEGRRGVVGSDRPAVTAALDDALHDQPAPIGLRISRAGARVILAVGQGRGTGTVWLVGFDRQHRTAVGGGENGGRVLLESNIVRSMEPVATWSGDPLRLELPIPSGEETVTFVQASDGRILDAARTTP